MACGRPPPPPPPPEVDPLILDRPYTLDVPPGYDGGPIPLVLVLHGYGVTGEEQTRYFGLDLIAPTRRFLIARPDGTKNPIGSRFWNATDACCDIFGSGVDDVAYLEAIIVDASKRAAVDPKRVYVIGHSNGGFMAHRLACDRAHRVAAIVSLAGAQWSDPARCAPSSPVSVLQAHGDQDGTVLIGGGDLITTYPSAQTTVATWAAKNGCTGSLTDSGTRDLDRAVVGEETRQQAFGGCPAGGDVELWVLEGSAHIPTFDSAWADAVYDFFSARPKP
jgi:polyhydroxybutyrate depolymerase